MHDTEPMPTVVTPAPAAPKAAPTGSAVARPGRSAILTGVVAAVALSASLGCAYLRGEVVALRGELQETRQAARAAERAANRASLDAATARTALMTAQANADPTPPPDQPDPDER